MKHTPRHAQARALALAGIPVFPCEVGGKRPACEHGFKDATTNLDWIDAKWSEADYNVAICPDTVGLAVVDVDGAEGRANWQALSFSKQLTYTVATPSGGLHVYYRGHLPPTASKIAAHIDTRGIASYVLVPPSVVNGKRYEVVHDVDYSELPVQISELIARENVRVTASVGELDLPGSIDRGRHTLATYAGVGDVAVSGRGGNDRTYKLACEILNLGLSQSVALSLIEEIWNPKCEPPWDTEELVTILEHAEAYAQNAQGAWGVAPAAEVFAGNPALDKLVAESTEAQAPRWKAKSIITQDETYVSTVEPISFGDVATQPPETVEELIPGWLEKGIVTFLEGPSGAHKSRLALHHCTVLANELAAYGDQRAKHCRSVYLNYENPAEEMARRVFAARQYLYRHNGDPLNDMADIEGWNLREDPTYILMVSRDGEIKLTAFGDKILEGIYARHDHTFLVVDNLMDGIRFGGNTRNEEVIALDIIKFLERQCTNLDMTILGLVHPARCAVRGGFQGGSSYAATWITRPRGFQSLSPLEPRSKGESVPAGVFMQRVVKRSHGKPGATWPWQFHEGTLKAGMPTTEES